MLWPGVHGLAVVGPDHGLGGQAPGLLRGGRNAGGGDVSHTPGPWCFVMHDIGNRTCLGPKCVGWKWLDGAEVAEDERRGYCAAPEMLEALEEFEALIRKSSGDDRWRLNRQATSRGELDLKVGDVLLKVMGEGRGGRRER